MVEYREVRPGVWEELEGGERFQTLRGLGRAIEVCGWIVVIGATIALVVGLAELLNRQLAGVISIVPALGALVSGIVLVSYGQVIQCFVATESNTRGTAQLLKLVASRQGGSQTQG